VNRWLEYCLSKPGAWQDEPWEGDVVAKVGPVSGGAKIFAFLGSAADSASLGLKCGNREAADLWLERYPGSVARMAYLGQHGWNTFRLDGSIADDELAELIDASYALVVAALPKSRRPSSPAGP
jgi:predicted DNA-binding protein (MmcQ/YjbR family)